MNRPRLNWPIVRRKRRGLWLYALAGAVAVVFVVAVALLALRNELSRPNYLDTDEEWLQLLSVTPEPEDAEMVSQLCPELLLVAEGKPSSKFRRRPPSQPAARQLVDTLCGEEASP